MQTLNINVNKDNLYDRLEALTHYQASKDTADTGAFERVGIVQANKEIIEQWVHEVAQQVTLAIAELSTASAHTSQGGYAIVLSMTDNWDNTLADACNDTAMNYFVARIAEKWFLLTDAEKATIQQTNAQSALSELLGLLHHRKRPSLPYDFTPHDDEEEEDNTTPPADNEDPGNQRPPIWGDDEEEEGGNDTPPANDEQGNIRPFPIDDDE